ncbi:MAG: ABC transporter substrate-binding protein, partial [Pseudomonadota bacterium]|nr:ABC transporter substrate-binding protein [Pseudomonadota bacterium]
VGWSAGTGEASDSLRTLVHSFDKDRGFGASNRGRYSNPEVDKLIQQAITTVDDEKRQALLAKATEVAMEDVAIVPVHYQVNNWAARKGLKYTPRTDEYTIVRSLKVAP